MKAAVVSATGGPEVMQYVDVPDPVVGDSQVIVKVAACGICGHDSADRAGLTTIRLPKVIGHEIAGEIVEVGPGVKRFEVGDRVASKQLHMCGYCYACRSGNDMECQQKEFIYGGGAEFVALFDDSLLPIPDNVSFNDASLTACAVGTCYQALHHAGKVLPGETVAVTGAGGGLGLHGMQVAAAMGAKVIGMTSSEAKVPLLKKHGADEVVLTTGNIPEQLREFTDGKGPEVVLDNVGTAKLFSGIFRVLPRSGRYVFTGQLYRERVSMFPAFVFGKEAVITGSASTPMAAFMNSMDLVAAGKVHGVWEEFPLSEAVAAHTAVDNSKVLGRAVLIP
jgi:acryloyl-coenzyme A reductase